MASACHYYTFHHLTVCTVNRSIAENAKWRRRSGTIQIGLFFIVMKGSVHSLNILNHFRKFIPLIRQKLDILDSKCSHSSCWVWLAFNTVSCELKMSQNKRTEWKQPKRDIDILHETKTFTSIDSREFNFINAMKDMWKVICREWEVDCWDATITPSTNHQTEEQIERMREFNWLAHSKFLFTVD